MNGNLNAIWILLLISVIISCGGGDGTGNIPGGGGDTPGEFIVDQSGEGDYTDIQSAVNDAEPGDVILVKNGTYRGRLVINVSGTSSNPITIMNYPDHSPVIIPGENDIDRVEFNAEHIIFEGFEVRGGWDGIKLYEGNNTVRNCYIHNNITQGILIVSASGITIEGNTIESNGSGDGDCVIDGEYSPKHCHGIYISDYDCTGLEDILIRNNHIIGHPGRGIQWNGAGCDSKMRNTIVEGNLIENNSWGLALFYNVEGAVISDNVFISNS
ncbi:MAG: right-handed parallel beta-helix repeat-containing protein, partial [Thermodesulfobacteriota bacterium]